MPVFIARWPNDDVTICTAETQHDVMTLLDEVDDPTDCVVKEIDKDIALSFKATISKDVIHPRGALAIPVTPLGAEIGALWKSKALESLYDARIRSASTPSEEIAVHKMVLAARSDYFKTMFAQKDLSPNGSYPVFEVPCDDEVLRLFIHVLYNDDLPVSDGGVPWTKVLPGSDKPSDLVFKLEKCVDLVNLADFLLAKSVGHTVLNAMVQTMHNVLNNSLDYRAKKLEAPTTDTRVAAAVAMLNAVQLLREREEQCGPVAAYFVDQLRLFLIDPDVQHVLNSAEFFDGVDNPNINYKFVNERLSTESSTRSTRVLDTLVPTESIEDVRKLAETACRETSVHLAQISQDITESAKAQFEECLRTVDLGDKKKLLDSAISLNPYVSDYYIHRSLVHDDIGDADAALHDADDAIRVAPFDCKSYDNKVELLIKYGNDKDTLKTYIRAYDLVQLESDQRTALHAKIRAIVSRMIKKLNQKIFLERNTVSDHVSGHWDGGTTQLVSLEFQTHSEFPELCPGLDDELNQLFFPKAGLALKNRFETTFDCDYDLIGEEKMEEQEAEFAKLFKANITEDSADYLHAKQLRASMEYFHFKRGAQLDYWSDVDNRWLTSQYRNM